MAISAEQALINAGFPSAQAKALSEVFAVKHHVHAPTEVQIDGSMDLDDWSDGVEERLAELESDTDEDEDGE